MRWKVRSSQYVLRDRWIAVRADDCSTPEGADVSPYYVLEYPDFVHVVAMDEHDNVVMVRQYRHGAGEVCLELPGGLVDPTDAGPLVTAARELKEETGYTGSEFELLATLSTNPANFSNRLHLVRARHIVAGNAMPDSTESLIVELVPRAEAIKLALSGEMLHAPNVALLLIALLREPRA